MAADFSSETGEAQYFSSAERKELSIQNPVLSENILHELRENVTILRCRKTKRIYHQQTHPPKKTAKRSSLNKE